MADDFSLASRQQPDSDQQLPSALARAGAEPDQHAETLPPPTDQPGWAQQAETLSPEPGHGQAVGQATATAVRSPAAPTATRSPQARTSAPACDNIQVPGYEILRELGRGGMGVVYLARHLELNRLVALKMILAGAHAGSADLARFLSEAEAVAAFHHPNIVQVYAVGKHQQLPFMALEFVEGGSLAERLAQGLLPAREAAHLIEQLAQGMNAAHQAGIVHRDLKPANVLLTEQQVPKITDFGLAKRLPSGGGDTPGGGLTVTGAILGTPAYMAPEQASGEGKRVGPAADVYALGAILYECLTGQPPFRAATPLDTLLKVVGSEPTPPTQLNPKVPTDLETICLKCLAKEPLQRYPSAAALAEDLRRWQADEPITARPVGRLERAVKWVKRNPVVTAMAVAVVLALTVGATVSYLKYLDAEQQKGIAEKQTEIAQGKEQLAKAEAAKAKKARAFLVTVFELSDAHGLRGTMTARQILDDAEKSIPEKFADQPELQKELLADVERVFAKITANAPLAMILEASGTVQLHSTRHPKQRALPQTLLYTGDRLSLGADAQVQLVFLSDLHQERLRPGREATIRRKGCEPADALDERTEDVMMTFVRLPKATFYMGWDGQKKGMPTEIREDFEIAVHDVTQGQWQAVMGDNPSYFSRFGGGRNEVKTISDEELKLFPVETVSWDDVQEFLKKLNEKARGSGYLYRLPSEAEWEYACRGGATSEAECSYHFYFAQPTNDLSSEQANFNGNFPFGQAPKGKYLGRTTRVGAYPPNKLGLCDMHGDVYQWCADVFVQGGSTRVIRGGSWFNIGQYCRAANRSRGEPEGRNFYLGFRLARIPVR